MRRLPISVIALLTAILLTGVFLLVVPGNASASGIGQTTTTETCLACHPRSFAGEIHGLGTTNPVFNVAWDQAGKPKECLVCHTTGYDEKSGSWAADTITCEACHNPIQEDHPNHDMPVNRSNSLCAQCHNDSRFGWTDWKTSVHYQQNMLCSNCHDPHLPKRAPDENISAYCEKCHEDVTKRAEHSTHAQAGVSCIQCHLGPKKSADQFHKAPDHSFKPAVETCNACHAQQMHDPKPTPMVTPTITPTKVVPTPTQQPALTPAPGNFSNITPFTTMDFTFMGVGLLGLGAIVVWHSLQYWIGLPGFSQSRVNKSISSTLLQELARWSNIFFLQTKFLCHHKLQRGEPIMKARMIRFLSAVGMAIIFASSTLVIAQAQTKQPPTPMVAPVGTETTSPNVTYENCATCHKEIYDTWQMGTHGQAMVDPIFTKIWSEQGQPGACLVCHATGYDPATRQFKSPGVTCESCHNPIPANHPSDSMPIDKTPDLCGKCHSDTRFATEDWQMSAHYKRSMTCSVCHDAHTGGMKLIDGVKVVDDASVLCANCHKDAMKNFPTSKHAAAGVTCVNCHLGYNVGTPDTTNLDFVSAHRAPDHNFKAKLETCNKCHANQMHSPGQLAVAAAIKQEQIGGTPTPQPTPVVTAVPHITNEPTPVSPVGFATMAGILGIIGGMVLAPWFERVYRSSITKGDKND